jgi:hypothetical protein
MYATRQMSAITLINPIILLILRITSYTILASDPEARVRFPALPEKKIVVGLERGPLSLVSTTKELLNRKVAAPV